MKLTAKTDLEVPAAVVFAALIDTPTWEREAIRNGVEVERPPGTPDSGVGAEWRIRGHFRGKARKVTLRIADMTPGQVQARFEKGLTQLGARIKDRYDRQA